MCQTHTAGTEHGVIQLLEVHLQSHSPTVPQSSGSYSRVSVESLMANWESGFHGYSKPAKDFSGIRNWLLALLTWNHPKSSWSCELRDIPAVGLTCEVEGDVPGPGDGTE